MIGDWWLQREAFEQMLMCRRRPSSASSQTSKTFIQSDVIPNTFSSWWHTHNHLQIFSSHQWRHLCQRVVSVKSFPRLSSWFSQRSSECLQPSSCRGTIWACSHSALENWPSVSRWQRFKMGSYLSASSSSTPCVRAHVLLSLWGPVLSSLKCSHKVKHGSM